MEGGYRSPSIMWMMPLDATILVLAKWTSLSPSRIWPWGQRRSRRLRWWKVQVFRNIGEESGNLVSDHLRCWTLWRWQLGWPLCGYGEGWPGRRLTAEDKEWKLLSNLFFHLKVASLLLCTFALFQFRCTFYNGKVFYFILGVTLNSRVRFLFKMIDSKRNHKCRGVGAVGVEGYKRRSLSAFIWQI